MGAEPKPQLVKQFLAAAVADCGPAHQEVADLVLFFLTNAQGTRPIKSAEQLLADLDTLDRQVSPPQLQQVLQVLVGSGLVFELPELEDSQGASRYQLVHDYLAAFIHQHNQTRWDRLRELRAQLQVSETKVTELLQTQLRESRRTVRTLQGFGGLLVIAALVAVGFAWQSENRRQVAMANETKAFDATAETLLVSNRPFDALLPSLKAGYQFQQSRYANPTLKTDIYATLHAAVYTTQERLRFGNDQNPVSAIAVSPQGDLFATAGRDGTVKLWAVENLDQLLTRGCRWLEGYLKNPDAPDDIRQFCTTQLKHP